MEHSEKIEVTPKASNFKRYADKLERMLKIILKLAQINAYDSAGRIKGRDGHFIDNSNLVQLITHTMLFSKALVGIDDFVYLLKKANVDPDLIANETIKLKLLNLIKSQSDSETAPKIIEESEYRRRPAKRKHDVEDDFVDEETDQTQSKRTRFETPTKSSQEIEDSDHHEDHIPVTGTQLPLKRSRSWVYPEDE